METPKPKVPAPNTLSFRPPIHIQGPVEKVALAETEEKRQKDIFDLSTPAPLEFKEFKKPEAKKPFELKPHLTQRPFHDERLMQLKETLPRTSYKNR
jgi:hypothetical protein